MIIVTVSKLLIGNLVTFFFSFQDSRQCNADTPTDQMDGLTSSDFSDQERLTMVSESSDYFSEGEKNRNSRLKTDELFKSLYEDV